MKNSLKILLVLTILALAIGLTTACSNNNGQAADATEKAGDVVTDAPEATEAPATAGPTAAPTAAPTEAPKPTETPEPTAAPTQKPELGENKGKMFTEGQEGVDVLYFEDFNDKDIDEVLEDAVTLYGQDHVEIIDGKLCLSFADGKPENVHNSFFFPTDYNFDDYEQFELSFDYKVAYTDPSFCNYVFMANMIGIFVSTPNGRIATSVGDGLFVSINNTGAVAVYGAGNAGENGGWPDGPMLYTYGTKNLFDEERHVTMVTTNEKKAYLYIDGELLCVLEVGDDAVTIYDAQGNAAATRKNDPENEAGSNMLIWTHCTGAIVDNYCLKAY